MSEQDGGGPAFPSVIPSRPHDMRGMTLRDYFAAQVIAGFGTWSPTSFPIGAGGEYTTEALKTRAELAYRQADAMLEARK